MASAKELIPSERLKLLAAEGIDGALDTIRAVVGELKLNPKAVGTYLAELLAREGEDAREATSGLIHFDNYVNLAIVERLMSVLPQKNGWVSLDSLAELWSVISQTYYDADDIKEMVGELDAVVIEGGWVAFDKAAALRLENRPEEDGEEYLSYEEILGIVIGLSDEAFVYLLQH